MYNIVFKEKSCINKYGEQYKYDSNIISMYVVLTRRCNTNCRFCEYHSGKSDIDISVFEDTLKNVLEQTSISTIHFTGGEPTLELDKLKQLCKIIKNIDPLITTSVNTNGTRLKDLENIEHLDNISLSRHALTDKDNQDIFRSSTVASLEQIKQFKDKRKLHMSCNLIKGYIDSYDKIIDYLELMSSLDVNDVGLVSLMNINEYCSEHYVNFSELDIKETDRFIKNRCFKNVSDTTGKICCMCENYLYRASNLNLISMYHRYAIKNNEILDYLVFENNQLKQGFNGKTLSMED